MPVLYNRIKRVRGKEAKWLGVIGGISKYLDPEIDPLILRLLWVLLAIFSGGVFMLFLYIVLAIVMRVEDPEEPEVIK